MVMMERKGSPVLVGGDFFFGGGFREGKLVEFGSWNGI